MTPLQEHCARWANGCGAVECGGHDGLGAGVKICLGRGHIPCDVLFIGQAPGESENVLGKVFVGPAGKLLDQIISRATRHADRVRDVPSTSITCAITNLVGCIPRDEDGKEGEPSPAQIKSCAPRLQDFMAIAQPRLIVAVGGIARDWLDTKYLYCVNKMRDTPRIDIQHPAYILRKSVAQQGLLIQRAVITLAQALEKL